MSPAREGRRDSLFDYACDNPAWTVDDVMNEFDWYKRQVDQAIHDLRGFLGEYDEVNVVCVPQGSRERHLYSLVGNLDGAREWTTGRIRDTETRIRTISAIASSVVSATDGRSIDGRKVRLMDVKLRHLIEEIDLIEM